MPPLRRLDTAGDSVRQVIRAYHGSPYDFDRFDASKIGTGEGAQTYGHGLYFAGNESVARDYRDRLKDMVDGPVPDELGDELQGVIKEIRGLAERRSAARGDEWPAIQKALDDAHSRHQDIQHRIRAASYNPGRMYEVEIGHPEDALLDLDAPASGGHKAALLSAAFEAPANKWQRMAIEEIASPTTPAKVVMESLMRAHNAENANKFLGSMRSRAAVADSLFRQGVPGTRYFDSLSRDAGDGTRNYVIFPGAEDAIRILRKYGVMAPIPAAAMTGGDE